MKYSDMRSRRYLAGVLLSAAFLFATPLCQANSLIVFSLEPVAAGAGTTGDSFEVLLTNDTGGSVTVGGFSFGIGVATANLTFTGVDTSTVTEPYIFGADSLFGPDISVQPPTLPGQTLEAEDLDAATGAIVASGASVGLGLVHFNIAGGTPSGPIAVTFISLDDSLANVAGGGIPFGVINGNVNVTAATGSAPEPATFLLAGLALVAIVAGVRRRAVAAV
jgi:hypothetical protein